MMVLMMAVVVSTGGRGRSRGSRSGRGGRTVVAVAGRGGRGGCGGRQVVAHGRVVRPGGHGRGGTEPVRGVSHLAASGQVTVSHGRVVHVGRGRGTGQTVEVGLVQVRVVHDGLHAVCVISRRYLIGRWPRAARFQRRLERVNSRAH